MNVVLLNGSPRKEGNTKQALLIIAAELNEEGIETEIINLGGHVFSGCRACGGCGRNKDGKCVIDDGMNDIINSVFNADGLVIGSPTYFANVTTEVKAFIDRCGYVSKSCGGLLKGKSGAAAVVARRAGADFVYAAINFFFGIAEMPIATSSYWNLALARDIGEMQKDEEGIRTFKTLGKNLASLIKSR